MIATTNAKDLMVALTSVTKAASKRPTLPVLANVHASYTDDGRLALYATDLEVGMRVIVDTLDVGREEDREPVTFPAADALAFVKSAPESTISIVSDGPDRVRIESPVSSVTLEAIDAIEYPTIPFDGSYDAGSVDGPAFARACKRAYVTAAHDEYRPILTGALMRATPAGLVIVTADNYRISESIVPWITEPSADVADFVVPARSLKLWAQTSARAYTVAIDVRPNSNQCRMTIRQWSETGRSGPADLTMVTRTIDGRFPNYQQVLPTAHETAATFDVKAAASAVKAIKAAAKAHANVVRVSLNGRMDLQVYGSGQVVAESSAPIVKSGDDLTIALNVEYLSDALASMDRTVAAYFNGPLSPIMLHSRDGNDAYRVCVMPIRVPA